MSYHYHKKPEVCTESAEIPGRTVSYLNLRISSSRNGERRAFYLLAVVVGKQLREVRS